MAAVVAVTVAVASLVSPAVASAAPAATIPVVSATACAVPTSPGVSTTTTPAAAPVVQAGVYDGVPLSQSQVATAQAIASVGQDMQITRRGVRIAEAVALQESSLNPSAVSGGVYVGLFQQKSDPSSGLYTSQDRTQAAGATRMFFEQLVKRVAGYDADSRADWQVGEVVQESGVGRNVLQWFGVAQQLTDAFYPALPVPVVAQAAPLPAPGLSASVGQAIIALFTPAATPTVGKAVRIPALRALNSAFVAAAPADGDDTGATDSTPVSTSPTDATGPSASGGVPTSGTSVVQSDSPVPAASSSSSSSSSTPTSPGAPTSSSPIPIVAPTPSPTPTKTAPTTTAAPTTKSTGKITTTTTTSRPSPTKTAKTTTSSAPAPVKATPTPAPTTMPTDTTPVVDTPAPPVPTGTTDDPGNGSDAPSTDTTTTVTPAPAPVPVPATLDCSSGDPGSTTFDPGMIISDAVFYNSKAMTAADIAAFLNRVGAACTGENCLRNLKVTTHDIAADRYCTAYQGGAGESVAQVLAKLSVACSVNPEVMLITLQKESALLTRTGVSEATYAAAYGWHCPDSGPGGSANCDPAYAGFFNQAAGMAKQWSRYRLDPQKYNYRAGQTVNIMWNVAETGCGGSPVYIRNTATASLYDYTPYQPNAASLAAYPGEGDRCSSYGNRNFFLLFQKYFGATGGGASANIAVNGVKVTIPTGTHVAAGAAGAVITAPTAAVAKGLAAGFAAVGLPYVYGGGTNGGAADQGCGRAGGAENSCQGIVGFDCSGLTGYVLKQSGRAIPDYSGAQRSAGQSVAWSQGQPGDIIGYNGHVAVYLGVINGVPYLLEAPDVGMYVQIRPVYYSNFGVPVDSVLHRYWA